MIDPNIRPGFIRDAGRFRARPDRMISQSDILKVSDEDLNWIEPAPLSLGEKIAGMLENGPALAILTRGGGGTRRRGQLR